MTDIVKIIKIFLNICFRGRKAMPKRELSQEYPQKDGMKHIPKTNA